MTRTGGDLLYRCRLCGEIDRSTHAPDFGLAVVYGITKSTPREWGGEVQMLDIHHCKNGRVGVSDFIGAEPDGWGETKGPDG